MDQQYRFKRVKAQKVSYCSSCDNSIQKNEFKILIYVVTDKEIQQHDDNICETIEYVRLIGITHENCANVFVTTNKQEHNKWLDETFKNFKK